ncbi:MAG TPA: Gfo/Idh/MocA family oxidoreductase [Calditrichia bacterium]|nr:Gfo/Idh/MocA family oxidoreductase [Calditrichota bacterium]HQV30469.1 Gfo/Idh/MocA family oxidoreductase [Calditrichia bacterium]
MKKVSWGILSTARIGVEKVIPSMQKSKYCRMDAIASRSIVSASGAASRLGIPRAYGSYEELLADPEIEAIYNPLPHHMHVEWTLKALAAGKHVLVEKPLDIELARAEALLAATREYPHLKVMEAFMYRHHPQWETVRELMAGEEFGELRKIQNIFTYYNTDPQDIRNQADIGGGGLLDIGCYCISMARFLFGREPSQVVGIGDFDPKLWVDRQVSGFLNFGSGTAFFTCSTQMNPHQYALIMGTRGRIEMDMPFTPPNDAPARLRFSGEGGMREFAIGPHDQYTLQGDLFSQAIINNTPVPTPLEDGVANMRVIDRVQASLIKGEWAAM